MFNPPQKNLRCDRLSGRTKHDQVFRTKVILSTHHTEKNAASLITQLWIFIMTPGANPIKHFTPYLFIYLFIGREPKRTCMTDGLEMRDQCKIERVYVLHKV